MKEIKFTAKQARELQLESDITKRNEIIEKFRREILDNEETTDGDLVNMQYDILLVAQTAYTRTVRFKDLNDEEYNKVRKLFTDAGYGFCHDDETGGFFIIF